MAENNNISKFIIQQKLENDVFLNLYPKTSADIVELDTDKGYTWTNVQEAIENLYTVYELLGDKEETDDIVNTINDLIAAFAGFKEENTVISYIEDQIKAVREEVKEGTAALGDLDFGPLNLAQWETLKLIQQTDGKITAEAQSILINASQISDLATEIVTIDANQTITGKKTFSNDIDVPWITNIKKIEGTGLLIEATTNNSGTTSYAKINLADKIALNSANNSIALGNDDMVLKVTSGISEISLGKNFVLQEQNSAGQAMVQLNTQTYIQGPGNSNSSELKLGNVILKDKYDTTAAYLKLGTDISLEDSVGPTKGGLKLGENKLSYNTENHLTYNGNKIVTKGASITDQSYYSAVQFDDNWLVSGKATFIIIGKNASTDNTSGLAEGGLYFCPISA